MPATSNPFLKKNNWSLSTKKQMCVVKSKNQTTPSVLANHKIIHLDTTVQKSIPIILN